MKSALGQAVSKRRKEKKSGIYIDPSKRGSLHSALNVPQSQKIPLSTINSRLAGGASGNLAKKLRFAKVAKTKFGK